MSSSSISGGSGGSTLTINVGSNVVAGPYTITIQATSGSLAHSKPIAFAVTITQDVQVTAYVSSLSFNSGASGTTTINVAPQNGFTGRITLAITAPTEVSCNLSSTNIQSSGTSTLTCNGRTAGDYTVTITATGGASPHTTTIGVHVVAVSPAAPAPPAMGISPAILYGIMGAIIIFIVSGTVLVLRRASRSRS
jgi:uncharacterized membrane protein